ncbi:hypothetical protein RRG08_063171 [Elysia crispata]|uniref:Uncharacterized protein n=1 Tax=Elysia crispata TaxID=231223 RepID=A0AAE1AXV8_9GAST|nr:hypothetical protein RRG08_063171 [Elysia crispata]
MGTKVEYLDLDLDPEGGCNYSSGRVLHGNKSACYRPRPTACGQCHVQDGVLVNREEEGATVGQRAKGMRYSDRMASGETYREIPELYLMNGSGSGDSWSTCAQHQRISLVIISVEPQLPPLGAG